MRFFTNEEAKNIEMFNKNSVRVVVPVWINNAPAGNRVFEFTPDFGNIVEHLPNDGKVGSVVAKAVFDKDGLVSGCLVDRICRWAAMWLRYGRYSVEYLNSAQYTPRNGCFAVYNDEGDMRKPEYATWGHGYYDLKEAIAKAEQLNKLFG